MNAATTSATFSENGQAKGKSKKQAPTPIAGLDAAKIVVAVERGGLMPDKSTMSRLVYPWDEGVLAADQGRQTEVDEWLRGLDEEDHAAEFAEAISRARKSSATSSNATAHPGDQATGTATDQIPTAEVMNWLESALEAKDVNAFFGNTAMLAAIGRLKASFSPDYEVIEAKVKAGTKAESGITLAAFRRFVDRFAKSEKVKEKAKAKVDTADFNFTDSGNAKRLVALHGDKMLYETKTKDWRVYNGKYWEPDASVAVERLSADVAKQVLAEIPPTKDENVINAYREFSEACESRDSRFSAITLARSLVPCKLDDFDSDPLVLNVQNGTVYLPTGERRPHNPSDRISKIAAVEYRWDALCAQFDQVMKDITNNDVELEKYIDRSIGYALSALNNLHQLNVFHGTGRNGKNLLTELVIDILGDYADTADPDLLLATDGDKHPAGVADLFGKRAVFISETDENKKFSLAQMKRLTGDKNIKARFMGKNFITAVRTFKLFLCTNSKPEASADDDAAWARIFLVGFGVRFVGKDEPIPTDQPWLPMDTALAEKLKAEYPGILARWVRGFQDYYRNGMNPPECVRQASAEYRDKNDRLRDFIQDCCHRGDGFSCLAGPLYKAYRKHSEEHGISRKEILTQPAFSDAMAKKGHPTGKKPTNRGYLHAGIALVSEMGTPKAIADLRDFLSAAPPGHHHSLHSIYQKLVDEDGHDKQDINQASMTLGVIRHKASGITTHWELPRTTRDGQETAEQDDDGPAF